MIHNRVVAARKALVGSIILLLSAVVAHADILNVTLTNTNETGSPGQTLVFSGTVSNPGATTVFLNSDIIQTGQSFLNGNGIDFLLDAPASLAPAGQPGDSTGVLDLFTVTITASAPPGTYTTNNYFQVLGGSTSSSVDLLATQTFSVIVSSVPEPGTLILFGSAIAGWTVSAMRRRRSQNTRK